MRRRSGFGLVDMLVAVTVVGLGLIPLLELLRSDVATIRVREGDVAVSNLAWAVLERVAARHRMSDPLCDELLADDSRKGTKLAKLSAELLGAVPEPLEGMIDDCGLILKLERRRFRFDGGPRAGRSLDVWTVKAEWKEGDQERSRRFFRVEAQG